MKMKTNVFQASFTEALMQSEFSEAECSAQPDRLCLGNLHRQGLAKSALSVKADNSRL